MNQELNTQTTQEVPKKKSPAGIIVLVLVILIVLGVGGWFLATKVLNKEEKKEDTKTEEKAEKKYEKKEEEETTNSDLSGIYVKDKTEIKVLVIDKTVIFHYLGESAINSYAELKGNVAKTGFGSQILTFNGDELVVEDNESVEEESISGTYKRTKDYTVDDFYKDYLGDPKYFNSKYNGKYENGKYEMLIYQVYEDKCRVNITGDFGVFDIEFDIKEDGSLYEKFFDDVYTVTFDGDKATFTTVESEDGEKEKDGTYSRKGAITKEEIIKSSY